MAQKSIASELLIKCEKWATSKGYIEFASDCELGNVDSLNFHILLGFEEANRIISFKKQFRAITQLIMTEGVIDV